MVDIDPTVLKLVSSNKCYDGIIPPIANYHKIILFTHSYYSIRFATSLWAHQQRAEMQHEIRGLFANKPKQWNTTSFDLAFR